MEDCHGRRLFADGYISTAMRRSFTEPDVESFRSRQFEALYDFFTGKTEYWKMSPHLELVASHSILLAEPGSEYVAYFPRGGTNGVELAAGTYDIEWLHAESGRYVKQPHFTADAGHREFSSPERADADWVLHLRRAEFVSNP